MTGYGRAEAGIGEWVLTVEVKSVNHRFREVWLHIPREWSVIEEHIRSLVAQSVARGKVDVYANLNTSPKTTAKYTVDEALLETVFALSKQLVERGLISSSSELTAQLLSVPGLITARTAPPLDDQLENLVKQATAGALQEMVAMRRTEGERLSGHLLSRLADVNFFVQRVRELYPQSVENFRVRLRERLTALLGEGIPDERLALETAIAAEKTSLEEELERLDSHLRQMHDLLAKSAEPIGRRMDFLLQEMGREVNTIGAKSNDLEISRLVVEAKHALEQLREQTQNVE